MRKRIRYILFFVIILFCARAFAADGTTEYSLDSIAGKLALADSYIVLTPANLQEHTELLASKNWAPDSLLADWEARGVILQAWVSDLDACLEVRVNQDEDAATYYDLDQQTAQARASYRTSHLKGTSYTSLGYSIKSADWKRQTKGGRFLRIKYKRTTDTQVYWGYAAKAVRNGWTLVLDYQVYGRGLRAKDEANLNKVANSVEFLKTGAMPATMGGLLQFTSVPPLETNTGAFTVEGTCTPEAHLIGVVMRYSSATPIRVEADATKAGKFKLKVQLPSEGIWLMALTVELNDQVIAEEVFSTTTYQATMLPVNLDADIPEQFDSDEYVLAGTTSKGVTVQCIVSGTDAFFDKTVRTNGTGRFSFKIPTSSQSEYQITLVFQKKNFETRRFSWTANRTLTEKDRQEQFRKQAIKPAYSTLTQHLNTYQGKVMGYKVYITDVQQVGEEWIVFAALTKTGKGTMKDLIVVTCPEDPNRVVGSHMMMYGICTGSYQIQSEEDTISYPGFDLLFWEDLD